MKYPQDKAAILAAHSNKLQSVADNSCLADCYLFCAGIDGTEIDYIINCCQAMDEGLLTSECFVKDADAFLFSFTGRKAKVSKKLCNSISEIIEPTPVLFKAEGKAGHWVVVAKGKIIFNPKLNSYNVAKGKPVEMRVIKWV